MNNNNDFAYFAELATEEAAYMIPEEVEFEDEFHFMNQFEDDFEDEVQSTKYPIDKSLIIIAKSLLNYDDNTVYIEDAIDLMDKVEELFRNKPARVQLFNEAICKPAHKQLFHNQITEELIAKAMHPHRMMARMQMFEDIEEFFECC